MSINSLESVSHQLIKLAGENYVNSGKLSPEILHSLYLVHGRTLLLALDLIDDKKIFKLVSPSGRWVYRVIGGSGFYYSFLPNSLYCQCPAFRFSVLKKKDSVMCKHVLAARLASTMDAIQNKDVTDDDMVDVLINI